MTPDYWNKAKKHLSKADPVLAKIIASYEGETLTKKNDPFVTLSRAIVGQQISVKAADSIWNRLATLCEITPINILNATEADLRGCGLSGRKVEYLKNIADFFASHNGVWHDDDEEVIKELSKIKGVGRWTAEMFLIFHLQRANILPLADIGLLKAVEKHYAVERATTAKIAEKWQPYRSVATWYMWRSLDPVPVEY